jgi:hypothetical protein
MHKDFFDDALHPCQAINDGSDCFESGQCGYSQKEGSLSALLFYFQFINSLK